MIVRQCKSLVVSRALLASHRLAARRAFARRDGKGSGAVEPPARDRPLEGNWLLVARDRTPPWRLGGKYHGGGQGESAEAHSLV